RVTGYVQNPADASLGQRGHQCFGPVAWRIEKSRLVLLIQRFVCERLRQVGLAKVHSVEAIILCIHTGPLDHTRITLNARYLSTPLCQRQRKVTHSTEKIQYLLSG